MGIEEEDPISFSTTGFSDSFRVSELAALITGKGLVKRVESGAVKAFRAVRRPANAFRRLVRHENNMLATRYALREHEQHFAGAGSPDDSIHLMMSYLGPIVDMDRTLLDTTSFEIVVSETFFDSLLARFLSPLNELMGQ